MIIRLPWPPKELSPNSPVHHHALARAKKKYGTECGWELKAQGLKKIEADELHLSIVFYPPDNRRRDLDNMLASIKAGLDAISKQIDVDDSKWELSIKKSEKIGGYVEIEIGKPNESTRNKNNCSSRDVFAFLKQGFDNVLDDRIVNWDWRLP